MKDKKLRKLLGYRKDSISAWFSWDEGAINELRRKIEKNRTRILEGDRRIEEDLAMLISKLGYVFKHREDYPKRSIHKKKGTKKS